MMKIHRSNKRVLSISIGTADRDPMFKPVWYDGAEPLAVTERRRKGLPDYPKPPLGPSPQWDFAPLPPPSDLQQNDHVMRYWNWRLDRLEAKRNG